MCRVNVASQARAPSGCIVVSKRASDTSSTSQPRTGTITRISWTLIAGSRTLRAEIDVDNADGSLRSGFEERPDYFSSTAFWYQTDVNESLSEPPYGEARLPLGNAQQIAVEDSLADVTTVNGKASVQREVDLSGTLTSPEQARISSEVAGIVRDVRVQLGTEVRAGDVIARLEPRELQLALDRAESALRQVEAQLGIDHLRDKQAPADDQIASMRQAMIDFTGGHLVDDVTMLVMRVSREEGGRAGQRDRRRASSRRRG